MLHLCHSWGMPRECASRNFPPDRQRGGRGGRRRVQHMDLSRDGLNDEVVHEATGPVHRLSSNAAPAGCDILVREGRDQCL
jgi:hypothetical protein